MDTGRKQSEQQMKQSRWGFRGKTVWNWLELLIVPLALAVIGLLFTMQQNAQQMHIEDRRDSAQQEIEDQRNQDAVLQAYLDQMSDLILNRDLLESGKGAAVYTLAQARTSTVVAVLDAEHNSSVTRFLT